MADPYAGFEVVEAPKDAKRSKEIITRVEREADRQAKGAPPPDVPQGGSPDPYGSYESMEDTASQGGAGRFAIPGMVPEPKNLGHYVVDAGKSFGSGVVKGAVGLMTLPGTVEQLGRAGINYANRQMNGPKAPDAVSPQSFMPGYQAGKEIVEQKLTGPLYTPKTTPGEYAGAIGEFSTGMLFPAAGAGGLGARAVSNVVGPAVASETAGQLTKGTSAEPIARVAGALIGGSLPQTVGSVVSPNRIDPARAAQAGVLEREGVQMTAGDRTGSKAVRWMESNAADTPFSGNRAQAVKEAQGEQFTTAVLRRAGIDAPRATPEVIDQAFQRIGGEFDTVAQAIQLPVSRQMDHEIRRIAFNYERTTEPSLRNPLPLAIAEQLNAMHSGGARFPIMTGEAYQNIRSQIGAAARGARDPRTSNALYQIQDILDDAAAAMLQRQSPDLAQRWQQARQQYRNMLVIERAAASAGENAALGLISPSALRNATKTLHGTRNYVRGNGDFADLARAGEGLLKPMPQSGTAPRLMAGALGGGLGAFAFGSNGPESGAAGGALGALAGAATLGRVTMNPMVQQYLSNQAAAGLRDLPRGSRIGTLPGANTVNGEVVIYPNGDPRNRR